jgi:hypothetical protein
VISDMDVRVKNTRTPKDLMVKLEIAGLSDVK